MHLGELLRGTGLEPPSSADPEVSGVCHDSRRVEPGDLYVAIVGDRFDGRRFAPEAIARGAVAILGPGPPTAADVPWVEVEDPRPLLGPLAARAYGHPDEELLLAGVTGTDGKSTVAAILASIFDAAGRPAGVLGTLGYVFREHDFLAELRREGGQRTTPEAPDVFRILAEMRRHGAEAAAMEVSSHSLAMGRVAGARYDVAIFTNLSRDHLDYHHDLESYFAAKRRLFDQLKPEGRAVVNLGDAHGRRLAEEIPGAFGFGPGGEVEVVSESLDLGGIRARLQTPRGELEIASPLVGRYNLENLLAAAAAAEALGLPHPAIAEGIARRRPLRGRMEPIDAGQPFPAFIDFAHTPAALEAVLRSLREITRRQIAVVFGCGGDRDPGKRPLMGRIAGELADLPVVTSDNPRSEDPLKIMAAIEEGLKESGNPAYRMMPDRREAIRRAVAVAAGGDGEEWALLVVGKGHEAFQIVGARRIPFSDHQVIERAIAERLAPQENGRG